jgi:hypothetical protein
MAITAEFIGVYIADIITTATITIIVATIITIIAIGKTCRVVAVSTPAPQGKGRSTQYCGLFPFPTPARSHEGTHHAEPLRHEPCPHVLSLRLVRGGAPGTRSISGSNCRLSVASASSAWRVSCDLAAVSSASWEARRSAAARGVSGMPHRATALR